MFATGRQGPAPNLIDRLQELAWPDSHSDSEGTFQLDASPSAFVSVVFESEAPLLILQARSMASFLPSTLVNEIVVIDNSVRGLPADVRRDLLRSYGHHSRLVRIVRPTDIRSLPRTTGWRNQQILKLCIAEQLCSERYVVLDAKNHFVRRIQPDFLQACDGRPKVMVHSYESHPLRGELERVLNYLGLDPTEHINRFTATITPFVLNTSLVREMIADIENRTGNRFEEEFVSNDLTEFFLYLPSCSRAGAR